jgi:hypothetical protein
VSNTARVWGGGRGDRRGRRSLSWFRYFRPSVWCRFIFSAGMAERAGPGGGRPAAVFRCFLGSGWCSRGFVAEVITELPPADIDRFFALSASVVRFLDLVVGRGDG